MKNNNPTIGLYGIDGVYNYGCEAIVRGTESILHDKWPDIRIKYASLRPEDDRRRLKGCSIEIVARKFKPIWNPSRLNQLLAYTGLYFKNQFREDIEWTNDCDIILSIGGDLYTLPPNYKDSRFRAYYNPLLHFGEIIKNKNKKLFIWGASIGPFEGYPKAKIAFIDHLRHVDIITSREPVTTKYLKNLKIKNVIECADPAFAVPTQEYVNKNDLNPKLHIGINLSPISSIYSFKSDINDVLKKQADVIASIIKEFDAQVTLIPHVVCDFDINDDDLRYLKLLKSHINPDVIDQVDLVENDVGFLETQKILSSCDAVIAARMHCAINTISIGIPTMFLGYSKKAYGMAEYVYGNDKWVIPLQRLDNEILEKLHSMIVEKENIRMFLNKRMEKILLDAYLPLTRLDQILKKIHNMQYNSSKFFV